MNRDSVSSIVVVAAALLTGVLYAADVVGPIRAVIATLFLLFGPGLAFVRFLGLSDPSVVITLAVAGSLGVDATIATGLLVAGRWSSGHALAILIAFTLACVLFTLIPALGLKRPATADPSRATPLHATRNISQRRVANGN